MSLREPIIQQPSFPGISPVEAAIAELASSGIEERGAIFTRREVVDFILDLVGYTIDRPLHQLTLLEPSFGHGDFLLRVAIPQRLKDYVPFYGVNSMSEVRRGDYRKLSC